MLNVKEVNTRPGRATVEMFSKGSRVSLPILFAPMAAEQLAELQTALEAFDKEGVDFEVEIKYDTTPYIAPRDIWGNKG